jgi:hypothetical protein
VRGRIRTVKPELFTDEKLWDLGVETGLPVLQAFIGLWCFADREGRFEWRPRALRAMTLPFWEGDMASVLEALASRSFIVRYTVNGNDYGYVRTFAQHQVINNREVPSEIPPPEAHATGTRRARDDDATSTREPRGLRGREGKGRELEGNGRGKETRVGHASTRERADATPLHRERSGLPEPDQTEPASYTRIPEGWQVTEEFYSEAGLAGVTREALDEDVAYWRGRKLGGEWFDIEQFFRAHFPRLARRRETEAFKRSRSEPDERLERQAERVEMLRAQEAEEARRAGGGA